MARKNPDYFQVGTDNAHLKLPVPPELPTEQINARPNTPVVARITSGQAFLSNQDRRNMHIVESSQS